MKMLIRVVMSFAMVIATMLFGGGVGLIISRAMPRVYAATALVYVQRDGLDEQQGQASQPQRFDPLFLKTQFEIIRSDLVLESVVKELNLHEILGRAYGYYDQEGNDDRTVQLVRKKLTVDMFRDTDLIAVTVKFDQPDQERNQAANLATDTANAIATTFALMQDRTSARVQVIQLAKKVDEIAIPISPNVGLNLMLGVVAGLFVGCVFAFFFVRQGSKTP